VTVSVQRPDQKEIQEKFKLDGPAIAKRNDRKNHRRKREEQIHCFSNGRFPKRMGALGTEKHALGCDTGSLKSRLPSVYGREQL
jgi:hypothetical protein